MRVVATLSLLAFAVLGWGQERSRQDSFRLTPSLRQALTELAIATVTAAVRGEPLPLQSPLAKQLRRQVPFRAGCFVTLARGTQVRGCMGTLAPTQPNLVDELVQAAVAAARSDPRYPPVTPEELPRLSISITVVFRLVPLTDIRQLRPEDGLVVRRGEKVGVVLPYEGKDPKVRLEWGKKKAGIAESEPHELLLLKGARWQQPFANAKASARHAAR